MMPIGAGVYLGQELLSVFLEYAELELCCCIYRALHSAPCRSLILERFAAIHLSLE